MELILVSDRAQVARACKIYDALTQAGKPCLILTGFGVEIGGNKYVVRNMQFYQRLFKLSFADIQQDSYAMFRKLAESLVSPGVTLRQLTTYKEVSLWDLSSLYLSSEMIPYFYYINIAGKILSTEKPQRVHILGLLNPLDNIFYLLSNRDSIECCLEEAQKENAFFPLFGGVICGAILGLKKIKRFSVSFRCSAGNFLKSLRARRTYRVIFFAPLERFFLSMLPVAAKFDDKERLVIDTYPGGAGKKLKEHNLFYTDFYGYKLYSLFNRKNRYFLKNIAAALEENCFFQKADYRGIKLEGLFSRIAERLIFAEFPEKIRLIDITRKIIFSYDPETVVVSDTAYDIAYVAKSLSRKVVALQSTHPEEFIFFGPVVADAVTVDGDFWKDYLVSQGVKPDKIWVTGSPKFDHLACGSPEVGQEDSVRRQDALGKTVIFATPYSDLAMGTIAYEKAEKLKYVCRAVKNIPDTALVIKIHPYDGDWEIYEEIAREAGLSDFRIEKNTQMLKLLKECDLLVTYHSVAGYEAVLMDKDVLWICESSDFRCDDIWDFKRSGAVAAVCDPGELEIRIRDILLNTRTQCALKRNRQLYRSSHVYGLDRNSASRVKEVIDRFLNNGSTQAKAG